MKFADVISGIAARLGLGRAPTPSADGTVAFRFADVEIRLTPIEDEQFISMETDVCHLPSAGAASFMAELLHYNARAVPAEGGAFAVDAEGKVFVRQIFSLALVNAAMFCKYLPAHLGHVNSWRMAALREERNHAKSLATHELPAEHGEDLAIFLP